MTIEALIKETREQQQATKEVLEIVDETIAVKTGVLAELTEGFEEFISECEAQGKRVPKVWKKTLQMGKDALNLQDPR